MYAAIGSFLAPTLKKIGGKVLKDLQKGVSRLGRAVIDKDQTFLGAIKDTGRDVIGSIKSLGEDDYISVQDLRSVVRNNPLLAKLDQYRQQAQNLGVPAAQYRRFDQPRSQLSSMQLETETLRRPTITMEEEEDNNPWGVQSGYVSSRSRFSDGGYQGFGTANYNKSAIYNSQTAYQSTPPAKIHKWSATQSQGPSFGGGYKTRQTSMPFGTEEMQTRDWNRAPVQNTRNSVYKRGYGDLMMNGTPEIQYEEPQRFEQPPRKLKQIQFNPQQQNDFLEEEI